MAEQTELLLERIHEAVAKAADPTALYRVLLGASRADVAEIFELLEDHERQQIMRTLDASSAGEVLSLLDEAVLGDVAEHLSDRDLGNMVATLEPDEAADVLGDLPAERTEQLLDHLSVEQSRQVADLMRYEPDTAGGLMTPIMVTVPETATVSEAITLIRQSGIEEELFNVYVVGKDGRLRGVVPLRLLVTSPPDTPVTVVMLEELISVNVDQDQEDVANVFRKYDLAAVPVIDKHGHLLGRITYDDVMDVAEEEAEEDMLRMAGTDPAEMESTSALRAVNVRARWLSACLIGTATTVAVCAFFKGHMPDAVFAILVLFGPPIAAISGNSGVQASTLTILGLSSGGLAGRNFARACAHELRIALGLAVLFGIAAGVLAGLAAPVIEQYGRWAPDVAPFTVGLAVGGAMLLAILYATVLGTVLPFALRRLGVDPAIAAGPLVTTLNDSTSWAIYLLLALLLLRYGL